jgi:branched-chain amino acid transport system ATP-binding protein
MSTSAVGVTASATASANASASASASDHSVIAASGTGNAIELVNVSSGYGSTIILRNVSISVPAGSVTALLGPNGAGKTTLLKTISGLIRPVSGVVLIDGKNVTKQSPNQRAGLGLCHIPEGRGIFRRLSVRQNLMLQANKGEEKRAIELAADAFPILGKRIDQLAGTLSGGEQQMLAMARTYVRDQRVILVDEASLGLAPLLVDSIFAFLHRLVEERNVSLLIVDQFVDRALAMASKAYILRHGELAFEGTAAELRGRDVFSEYLGVNE